MIFFSFVYLSIILICSGRKHAALDFNTDVLNRNPNPELPVLDLRNRLILLPRAIHIQPMETHGRASLQFIFNPTPPGCGFSYGRSAAAPLFSFAPPLRLIYSYKYIGFILTRPVSRRCGMGLYELLGIYGLCLLKNIIMNNTELEMRR